MWSGGWFMSTTLSKWMTLFISITIMFTPLLAYLDSLHREAVDVIVHRAMKEASINGSFSENIIESVRNELIESYNFSPNSIIEITGTTNTVPRGGLIEASITVKRTPLFVINLFDEGNPNYTRKFTIMSEYIP